MAQNFTWPASSVSISSVTANQGTANTVGNAWPIKITDGTDTALVSAGGELSVSAASLPLPTGAATAALQTTGNTSLSSIDGKIPASLTVTSTRLLVDGSGVTQPVSGTVTADAGTGTFAVSAASLPLPTGAATAAKQPALGTAGAASADVITVQGIASMTALKVDGSAVTQPVSIAATVSSNTAQIGGNTVSTGNGVVGTGVQRVAIASDNTAFTVNTQTIPQSGSTNAASSAATTALAASLVVKASAGRLLQLTGVNTKTSAQYIQVFNATSAPADGTAPILLAYVPAGGNFSFDFGAIGRYFSTGITVTNSSTAATKTIGSSDCWFNAEYL